jgi:hypothetical protein
MQKASRELMQIDYECDGTRSALYFLAPALVNPNRTGNCRMDACVANSLLSEEPIEPGSRRLGPRLPLIQSLSAWLSVPFDC